MNVLPLGNRHKGSKKEDSRELIFEEESGVSTMKVYFISKEALIIPNQKVHNQRQTTSQFTQTKGNCSLSQVEYVTLSSDFSLLICISYIIFNTALVGHWV